MNRIDLRELFTPQAVGAVFKQLPPMKTTVIDRAFPKAVSHPMPLIGVSEIKKVTGTIPLVRRGSNPVTLSAGGAEAGFYAPVPVMPAVDITAAELNDLKVIMGNAATKETWMANQIDTLRRIVRNTTEAIASVALVTGKYEWPIKLEGGKLETFTIDFGAPQTLTLAEKLTADSTLDKVYDVLNEMADKIAEAGYGESVKFFAGKAVFGVLINVAQKWAAAGSASPVSVKLEGGSANIGGYVIERMSEKYYNPATESMVAKIADNDLVGYGVINDAGIYYCAIDSLSANNRALPFHVYPEQIGDTAIKLQAQSKPVPVRPPKSVCVTAAV